MSVRTHMLSSHSKSNLIRRFGMAGFLFFFIKGMAWLSLPLLIGLIR